MQNKNYSEELTRWFENTVLAAANQTLQSKLRKRLLKNYTENIRRKNVPTLGFPSKEKFPEERQ